MHINKEDFEKGWIEIGIGIKKEEIEKIIENLRHLKNNPDQHFHFSSKYENDSKIADIEIYIQGDKQKDNMSITGFAIEPNR
jgi:hypothetical protein